DLDEVWIAGAWSGAEIQRPGQGLDEQRVAEHLGVHRPVRERRRELGGPPEQVQVAIRGYRREQKRNVEGCATGNRGNRKLGRGGRHLIGEATPRVYPGRDLVNVGDVPGLLADQWGWTRLPVEGERRIREPDPQRPLRREALPDGRVGAGDLHDVL